MNANKAVKPPRYAEPQNSVSLVVPPPIEASSPQWPLRYGRVPVPEARGTGETSCLRVRYHAMSSGIMIIRTISNGRHSYCIGRLLIMLWLVSMAPDKQSASPTSGMRGHSG
jgi:hypothetical protein